MRAGFWCGNRKERDHLEDLGIDGRIILIYILRKWEGDVCELDLSDSGTGQWQAVLNTFRESVQIGYS
jgi:hypothetical protein